MKTILVNYSYDPAWLKDYPELEVTLYDRSDDGIERNLTQYGKVFKTKNLGDVDCDKLSWLIENYNNLPDVFLWSKSNIFKFVDEDQLKKALKNKGFMPLLKQDHRTYSDKWGTVNFYRDGMYHERNDSWFFNAGLDTVGRFGSWDEWALAFALPREANIPFAPGGSYILTKERVRRYSKDYYESMRDCLPYAKHPVEAHCAERSYYYLWR